MIERTLSYTVGVMATTKKIGPSFSAELEAYGGLLGEHFSWQPVEGTLEFFDDTPEKVRKGVQEVYDAHDPDVILADT